MGKGRDCENRLPLSPRGPWLVEGKHNHLVLSRARARAWILRPCPGKMTGWSWKQWELLLLVIYAVVFYTIVIYRSLRLSHAYYGQLPRLQPGWMLNRLNDISDSQWRNFRGNLPILTLVLAIFMFVAKILRSLFNLKGKGMSIVWLLLSLSYLSYLHGACVLFILLIVSANFFVVKEFSQSKYFSCILWIFNISILLSNRICEGYAFSSIGQSWAFLDNYRGTFRWHICFNFVTLRMISFGYDYHWAHMNLRFNEEKHMQRCTACASGKSCYISLQESPVDMEGYTFTMYLCYLLYAPLYIAGPIISFNAFASQLDVPQRTHSVRQVVWYGFRWILNFFLLEFMTHFFYYNAFATCGLWRQLCPLDIFIIGYGVLNFMWLKFLLIWRYFRMWSLIGGIETPENMPKCINNCHDLESFWKNWHASYNKWLVRYLYVPLGGSQKKLLNVWVIFTFVAIWHDLEWKLLSWAWLTCLFMIPEIIVKSTVNMFQEKDPFSRYLLRELNAIAGAITITCLMVSNLAGYVIGPENINWLLSRLLMKDGVVVIFGIFISFYVGTKLMFHIRDAKQNLRRV
uniref:Putative membrane-bound O-acyltransferase C24H6.01c n=1 Tax=Anthurium amnicola TaxID=1678845 RepID=A0A1D1XRT0_9ARAE